MTEKMMKKGCHSQVVKSLKVNLIYYLQITIQYAKKVVHIRAGLIACFQLINFKSL